MIAQIYLRVLLFLNQFYSAWFLFLYWKFFLHSSSRSPLHIPLFFTRCFSGRSIPAFFSHYRRLGPVGHVVWGHDLHTVFIEDVQNVLMKFGIKDRHLFGFVSVNIQFIGHVKIIQRFLQHERLRLRQQSGSLTGCHQKHCMNLTPRCVVTNAHTAVWRISPLSCALAE